METVIALSALPLGTVLTVEEGGHLEVEVLEVAGVEDGRYRVVRVEVDGGTGDAPMETWSFVLEKMRGRG